MVRREELGEHKTQVLFFLLIRMVPDIKIYSILKATIMEMILVAV